MPARKFTITLAEPEISAIRDEAKRASVTPSAVVRAAAETLRDGGPGAAAIRERIRPTGWGGSRPGPRPARRVRPGARRIELLDLVEAGVVPAGAELVGEYRGHRLMAHVLGNGRMEFESDTYSSLSAAGQAAKATVRGGETPTATSGWDFWRVVDPVTDRRVQLRELRDALRARREAEDPRPRAGHGGN